MWREASLGRVFYGNIDGELCCLSDPFNFFERVRAFHCYFRIAWRNLSVPEFHFPPRSPAINCWRFWTWNKQRNGSWWFSQIFTCARYTTVGCVYPRSRPLHCEKSEETITLFYPTNWNMNPMRCFLALLTCVAVSGKNYTVLNWI